MRYRIPCLPGMKPRKGATGERCGTDHVEHCLRTVGYHFRVNPTRARELLVGTWLVGMNECCEDKPIGLKALLQACERSGNDIATRMREHRLNEDEVERPPKTGSVEIIIVPKNRPLEIDQVAACLAFNRVINEPLIRVKPA